MKNTTIFFLSLLLSCATSKAEVTCRTDLKESDTYKDLGTILSCMSRKIKTLEKDIEQIKSSPKTDQNISCGSEKAEKFTASLTPTLSGSSLSARVSIRNDTSEPLFLAADEQIPAAITSDRYFSNATLKGLPQGISVYAISLGGVNTEQAYTRIGPGQTHSIRLTFETQNVTREIGEAHVTVTMNFLSLDNGNIRRVAASPCSVIQVRS